MQEFVGAGVEPPAGADRTKRRRERTAALSIYLVIYLGGVAVGFGLGYGVVSGDTTAKAVQHGAEGALLGFLAAWLVTTFVVALWRGFRKSGQAGKDANRPEA
jgi:hypothetical protein